MRNLADNDDDRKQALMRFIWKSPWYVGLLCLYFLSIVAVIQIEKGGKTAPVPVCPAASMEPAKVVEIHPVAGPMRDARIQCLAAVLAKSPRRWELVVEELGDSHSVCLVAEGMYPRSVVPEVRNLPPWAVKEATRAVDHAD